jgi:hypothetical protein
MISQDDDQAPCTDAPDKDTVLFKTSCTPGISLLVLCLDKLGFNSFPITLFPTFR